MNYTQQKLDKETHRNKCIQCYEWDMVMLGLRANVVKHKFWYNHDGFRSRWGPGQTDENRVLGSATHQGGIRRHDILYQVIRQSKLYHINEGCWMFKVEHDHGMIATAKTAEGSKFKA